MASTRLDVMCAHRPATHQASGENCLIGVLDSDDMSVALCHYVMDLRSRVCDGGCCYDIVTDHMIGHACISWSPSTRWFDRLYTCHSWAWRLRAQSRFMGV
jgi:hypothetical protein